MSSPKLDQFGSYDPRAVANLMLDEADRIGIALTSLALQRLLYFAHGASLVESDTPLVIGYFEAWKHGPVHPVVHEAFASADSTTISTRATRLDIQTWTERDIPRIDDPRARRSAVRALVGLGHLPSDVLVDIFRARNSPWHFTIEKSRSGIVLGMRITNNTIKEKFRYHVAPVVEEPHDRGLIEDEPAYGFGACEERAPAGRPADQKPQEAQG